MKAGRAQCPACFFCFLARETSLFFERRPFFSSEGPPLFRAVRTKTFSTHDSCTRPDMRPRSRGALLLVDVYPVEGLEPGEPASPYTWGVAVGVAQELLDAVADLA